MVHKPESLADTLRKSPVVDESTMNASQQAELEHAIRDSRAALDALPPIGPAPGDVITGEVSAPLAIEQKPPRKIAIVGKATSSMMLAPYDDESWEIWGLSDCWRYVPRLTRSFEIHDYETGKHRWKKEYTDWLAKNQKMVWIHAPHEDLPDANIFPFQKLLEEFHPYFTNSVSWMLALAMLEGCSEIGLFGVDMAQSDPATGRNGEYEHQRPSCEYFIGLAQGMGIKVNIPPQSDLLKAQQLYAYQSHKGDRYVWHQARLQELSNRMNTLVAQERRLLRELEDTRRNISRMQGAIESDEYTLRARPGG